MLRIDFPYVEVFKVLDASVEEIWELLVDTRRWKEWGPSIDDVVCHQRRIRLGTAGKIRTRFGLWVPFRVTRFQESHYWLWEIRGISATGHRVEVLNHGSCRLAFLVPLWAFPYSLVCFVALQRIGQIVSKRGSTGTHPER